MLCLTDTYFLFRKLHILVGIAVPTFALHSLCCYITFRLSNYKH